MNTDYQSFSSLYNTVIQLIIVTAKELGMNPEVTHWEKLTSLLLSVIPKMTMIILTVQSEINRHLYMENDNRTAGC